MFKFLGKKLRRLFGGKIDEEKLDELEELFYEADLGAQMSADLTDKVRTLYKKDPDLTAEGVLAEIKKDLLEEMSSVPKLEEMGDKPHVMLIVGVNGNGKTTTIAKLANHYKKEGKKVLIAAADTFRAAAIDQLETWADKIGATLVKGKHGSDAAAVVFDALEAAKSRGYDIVLVDTAGRLHTKTDLMQELEKIHRVSGKALPGAPHQTLLVLDATIGQNGVEQAQKFHEYTPLSGIILTKIDGTAKGGTALAIQKKLRLPIAFLGTGESLHSIQEFDSQGFIDDLLAID